MGAKRAMRMLAVMVLATLASPVAAAARRTDDPIRVSRTPATTRTYEGPAVAIAPDDPERIYVAAADLQDASCHVFRSSDAGLSFTELDPPDFGKLTDCGLNRGGLPQNIRMKLAVDSEGVVYWAVAVADPAAGGPRNVVLARSDDGGDSWSTTLVAEAPIAAQPQDAVTNFVPDLFVNPFDEAPHEVWVSWRRSFTDASGRVTEGWARRSTDGGKTFGPELRGIEANPGFDAPRVVTDAEGRAYWFQRERPARPAEGEEPKPSPLRGARSDDGGQTWQELQLGEAHLVMEEPLAAVSPEGDALYLAWADGRNGDLDVFFMRSTDAGKNWTDPIRVNSDRRANKRSQKWPRMSVAPQGRIDVAWYDYRHDAEDVPADDVEFFLGKANDVYLASSSDGGETFDEDVRVTDASIDRSVGTYNTQYFVEVPPGVGSSDRRAFVAWSDTRLGDTETSAQDIFGVPMDHRSPTSPGWWLLIGAEVALALAGVGLLLAVRRRRAVNKATASPVPA